MSNLTSKLTQRAWIVRHSRDGQPFAIYRGWVYATRAFVPLTLTRRFNFPSSDDKVDYTSLHNEVQHA